MNRMFYFKKSVLLIIFSYIIFNFNLQAQPLPLDLKINDIRYFPIIDKVYVVVQKTGSANLTGNLTFEVIYNGLKLVPDKSARVDFTGTNSLQLFLLSPSQVQGKTGAIDIKVTVNKDRKFTESNYTNNSFSRIITIAPPGNAVDFTVNDIKYYHNS